MRTNIYFLLSFILLGLISCGGEKKNQQTEKTVDAIEKQIQLDSIYNTYQVEMTGYDTTMFNRHYDQRIFPPIINLNQSLDNKSISDLYLLKNTLLAMKGKVFIDATLASHFKKLPWYQPPFWRDNFEIELSDEEKIFIIRIDQKISDLRESKSSQTDGVIAQHAVNLFQYKNLPSSALSLINANGFILLNEPTNQPSEQYIKNLEHSLPSFVTTDLVLHQMHLLYGTLENEIEAIYLSDILKSMLEIINVELYSAYEKTLDSLIEKTIEESLLYYSIPYGVITGNKTNLIGNYNQVYYEELGKVLTGEGTGSKVMKDDDFNYNVFIPHGHYAKNENIKKYYKALTWLQKISLCLNDDEEFSRAILIAYIINKSDDLKNSYRDYVEVKTYFSSQKDQFTFWDLADVMGQVKGIKQFEDLFKVETVKQIKELLNLKASESCEIRVSLMPVEYQNLYTDLKQIIKDVEKPSSTQLFAALGNSAAQELTGDLNDAESIMENLLKISTQEEAKSMDWLSTLLASLDDHSNLPAFMNQQSWKMKGLNTSKSSWVLLNQRVNIQIKKLQKTIPTDTATTLPGYVEPNISFWNAATTLLGNTRTFLNDRHMLSNASAKHINDLYELILFLKSVSEKEITNEPLNKKEYDRIASIGQEIQRKSIDFLNTGLNSENYQLAGRSAYATNVFRGGQGANMIAGTGPSHSIIIPVEIEGNLYLTHGAIYSYYEIDHYSKSFMNQKTWVNMTSGESSALNPLMKNYYFSEPPNSIVASN